MADVTDATCEWRLHVSAGQQGRPLSLVECPSPLLFRFSGHQRVSSIYDLANLLFQSPGFTSDSNPGISIGHP